MQPLMEDDKQLPPGTVRLIDVDGNVLAKHAGGLQNDLVLHPRPSEDPEDPLSVKPMTP